MPQSRTASIERKTRETLVKVKLNLDGEGTSETNTGIGFLDHMLDQLAFHGLMDLEVSCEGDLHIDSHHSMDGNRERKGVVEFHANLLRRNVK